MVHQENGELRTEAYTHNSAGMEYPCVLCGESHHQAHAAVGLYGVCDPFPLGDLCPSCVAAGPAGAAERARQHAEELRQRTEQLRALAEHLAEITAWASLDALKSAQRLSWEEFFGETEKTLWRS